MNRPGIGRRIQGTPSRNNDAVVRRVLGDPHEGLVLHEDVAEELRLGAVCLTNALGILVKTQQELGPETSRGLPTRYQPSILKTATRNVCSKRCFWRYREVTASEEKAKQASL